MIDRLKAMIEELVPEAAKYAQVLQAQQFLQGAVIELEQHRAAHPDAPADRKPGKSTAQRAALDG